MSGARYGESWGRSDLGTRRIITGRHSRGRHSHVCMFLDGLMAPTARPRIVQVARQSELGESWGDFFRIRGEDERRWDGGLGSGAAGSCIRIETAWVLVLRETWFLAGGSWALSTIEQAGRSMHHSRF